MAEHKDVRPIESKSELMAWIEKGNKPKDQWRIGTEHEKFCFLKKDLSPLPYGGDHGIEALLYEMGQCMAWDPIMEGDNIIGLIKNDEAGGSVTLEPGGQLELSGAPLKTLHETCSEVNEHLKHAKKAGKKLGIGYLGAGFSPKWKLDEIELMPKGRYDIMSAHMPKVGKLGLDMMFRSTTVQVNLDFSSEADMTKKFRTSLALQPITTAIFANSPFTDGKLNGYLSYRSALWLDTDPARTGMIPWAFEDGMGFERYTDYALDIPMYFFYRDGKYLNATQGTFRQFMAGEHPQYKGEKPSLIDWENHLSTLFPEVRLKRFLEMRGADGGRWRKLCAMPALWVGLLYDGTALDAAWDLVKDWTDEERQQLREDVPKLALDAPFRDGTVNDIAKQVLEISRIGLKNRNFKNPLCEDETTYLESIQRIVDEGKPPASRMIEQFENEWHGDIDQIFKHYAY